MHILCFVIAKHCKSSCFFSSQISFCDCQTLQIIMLRSSKKYFVIASFSKIMLCDYKAQLIIMCSYSQIVFCGWKSLHLLFFVWSTHMNFTSLWFVILMFQYFNLWQTSNSKLCTTTTCPPYSCPSNSRSNSRLPRENTTVNK